MSPNESDRFERVKPTAETNDHPERPSRGELLDWWENRYGIEPATFEGHSFWEKGAGRIWVVASEWKDPIAVEAMGLPLLRTRQRHWKPTTVGARRFGKHATIRTLTLDEENAHRFMAGESIEPDYDGEWGYVIVQRSVGETIAIMGIGLYTYGQLESQIPKHHRRTLGTLPGWPSQS